MSRFIREFLHRHEPPGHWHHQLKAGIGACVGMAAVAALSILVGIPLLIAPFGATAVLVFGQPRSAFAQPANALGGYLTAVLLGCVAMFLLPNSVFAAAVAVGLSIAMMLILRVTHPPAGAMPIVALTSTQPPAMLTLIVMLGAVTLVAIAFVHHLIPPAHRYPLRPE